MASRSFYKFLNSLNCELTFIECNVVIDSGQPTKTRNLKGSGVVSVNHVATGTYQVVFKDTYYRYVGGEAAIIPAPGTPVAIASLSSGVAYFITTLGTSQAADWQAAGLSSAITPAVGVSFVAGSGASGATGTGYAAPSSVVQPLVITTIGDPNTTITSSALPSMLIQCFAATSSSNPTLVLTDPPDNSVLGLYFFLRNSTVLGLGETPLVPGNN